MVASAVSFLSDPKVQVLFHVQRVSFLESKGLRPVEIDEAIRQAGQSQAGGSAGYASYAAGPAAPYYGGAPYGAPYPGAAQAQQQGRDWRDWFIMAVVSGTIGYGVISLAKKYLMPHLQPPNANVLEADLDSLTANTTKLQASCKPRCADTRRKARIGTNRKPKWKRASRRWKNASERTYARTRSAETENLIASATTVDGIRKELGSLFEKSKQAQTNSLSELQSELKSLKSLLVSRGTVSGASGGGYGGAAPAPPRPYGVGYGAGSYGSPTIVHQREMLAHLTFRSLIFRLGSWLGR